MALRATAGAAAVDYWPGFVDAMATLLLVIIFLLSIFVLAQFFLSPGDLRQGHGAQPPQRADQRTDRTAGAGTRQPAGAGRHHSRRCRRASRRPRPNRSGCRPAGKRQFREPRPPRTGCGAPSETCSTKNARSASEALAQVELLNQQISALRRQIAALEDALEASEANATGKPRQDRRSRPAPQRRAGAAGAGTVALPLGLLRPAARNPVDQRSDIRVVGDRFVFQSEVLFDSGSGRHQPGRRAELDKLAERHQELQRSDPRRDQLGAAGRRPHRRPPAVRHRTPAQQLGAVRRPRHVGGPLPDRKGRRPKRLVAAGFGEFQPLEEWRHPEAPRPQPPHRAQADRALKAAASASSLVVSSTGMSVSTTSPSGRGGAFLAAFSTSMSSSSWLHRPSATGSIGCKLAAFQCVRLRICSIVFFVVPTRRDDLRVLQFRMVAHQPQNRVRAVLALGDRRVARPFLAPFRHHVFRLRDLQLVVRNRFRPWRFPRASAGRY
jgi:chemotaxis protein MotB